MTPAGLPPAYGRESKLAEAGAVFDRRQSAVVLLQFEAQIEKHPAFVNLLAQARQHGWSLVPRLGSDPLAVGSETTERVFGRALSDALARPGDGPGASPATLDRPRGDPAAPDGEARPAGRRRTRIPATRAEDAGLHRYVRQLRAFAPVALALDCTDTTVAPRWLADGLLGSVRHARWPIVALVAVDVGDPCGVGCAADAIVHFGPLEPDDVRACIRAVGDRLTPPMEAGEIEHYVAASRENPPLLRSLVDLFTTLSGQDDVPRHP